MKRISMRRVRGGSPSYCRADSPRFTLWFLKWFCNPEYHYDIEGDLLEILRQTSRKQLAKVRLIGTFSKTSFPYPDQELSGPQHFSNH